MNPTVSILLGAALSVAIFAALDHCSPVQAAMEPEEIMVRLATGLQVPLAYRQMAHRPRHRSRRAR